MTGPGRTRRLPRAPARKCGFCGLRNKDLGGGGERSFWCWGCGSGWNSEEGHMYLTYINNDPDTTAWRPVPGGCLHIRHRGLLNYARQA